MSRTASGAVTIMDVQDGVHPIALTLSNHSHTFAADATGLVPDPERTAFTCEVFAYVGATRCIVDDVASYANNTYRVTKVDSSGWVSSIATIANQSVVTLTTIPTGTTNKTGTVTLTIIIVNAQGNETTITAIISLAKAIEGTAGQIVQLTPNRQTFRFNELGVTTDGTISIDVKSAGNTGALSAQYSRNGAAWAALAVGAGANQAASIDINGSAPDTITITAANFGTSDTFAVKVSGATGGSDSVSIVKIQDGATGPGALLVVIESNSAGFIFKNNAGTAKVLSVVVYDMKTGGTVVPTGYQWKKNGVNLATTATITVNASDITDNSSEQYSCVVTVA